MVTHFNIQAQPHTYLFLSLIGREEHVQPSTNQYEHTFQIARR